MKRKLKRIIYTIEDHIKDSKEDLKNAYHEKEDDDSIMASFYVQSSRQRLEMANKGLDKYIEILKSNESRERANGEDSKIVEEKNTAWRCVFDILIEKLKYIQDEIQEFRM